MQCSVVKIDLAKSAEEFVRQFEILIKIILEGQYRVLMKSLTLCHQNIGPSGLSLLLLIEHGAPI